MIRPTTRHTWNKPEAADGQFYTKLARCLAMLRRLAKAPLHISYLSEQYGVSKRTIERDIAVLILAGHPIVSENGKGWYNLERP